LQASHVIFKSEKFEWFDPSPIEPFNSGDDGLPAGSLFLATYDLSTGSQEVKLRKEAESTKNPQEKPKTGERELRPDSSFFLGGSWNPSFFFNSKLKMLWSQITNPPCRLGFLIWVKGFIHAG